MPESGTDDQDGRLVREPGPDAGEAHGTDYVSAKQARSWGDAENAGGFERRICDRLVAERGPAGATSRRGLTRASATSPAHLVSEVRGVFADSSDRDQPPGRTAATTVSDATVPLSRRPVSQLSESDKANLQVSQWLRNALQAWEEDLAEVNDVREQQAQNLAIDGILVNTNAVVRGLLIGIQHGADPTSFIGAPPRTGADVDVAALAAKNFTQIQWKETKLCLKPLRKQLRFGLLDVSIAKKLSNMTKFCDTRNYIGADSEYMKLAIGNKAWPLGVTSVGIHERKAHDRISEDSVAHILTDEGTRKYIHAFKRLMTYCQTRWP
jgi:hypothetical protein